ncbi:MAG: hypothetical protein NTZ78_03380 [Candidatus Aureabacteria bacterium]|nr:hypothetical protein [Candidatus Auribacterota bacterium]
MKLKRTAVLWAIAVGLQAGLRGEAASPVHFYALSDKVSLKGEVALLPTAENVGKFSDAIAERARERGCPVSVAPFLYGSGFLRCNVSGADCDAGIFVDIGRAENIGDLSRKIECVLAVASAEARSHRSHGLFFLGGFDPGATSLAGLGDAVAKAMALRARSADPHYYIYCVSAADGIPVPNRLFRDTLPLPYNVRFSFASDSVKYRPEDLPLVKRITVQIFFIAEISGERCFVAPLYEKGCRIILPQLSVFNCAFLNKGDAARVRDLLVGVPSRFLAFENLTQIYSAMCAVSISGDRIKFLKRAHQVCDAMEDLIPQADRERIVTIVKKYLSDDRCAEIAYLCEFPSILRECIASPGSDAAVRGGVREQLLLVRKMMEHLAAHSPRMRDLMAGYAQNDAAILRALDAGKTGEMEHLCVENEKLARRAADLLVERSEIDFLKSAIDATLILNKIGLSTFLINTENLPLEGKLAIYGR